MKNVTAVVYKNAMGTLRKLLRAWGNQRRTLRGSSIGGRIGRVTKHPSHQAHCYGRFREREYLGQGTKICESWHCVGNCFLFLEN